MNKFFASTLFAAIVFSATSASAQGASAAPMGKGHGISNSSSGSSAGPAARTTLAGLPVHSPTSHEYNNPTPNANARFDSRGYTQDRFIATAVVVPSTLDFRSQGQRTLHTSAPTKSAAMSRMRQMIDAIGVPVTVISIDLTSF